MASSSARWPPAAPQGSEGPPRAPNQQWWTEEPGAPRPGLQRRRDGPASPPHDQGGPLRLIGHLKATGDLHFAFFEHKLLEWVQLKLTRDWRLLQCGHDGRAKALWSEVFQHLELDTKAIRDLMLLTHLGEAGRAEANEILWNLLSNWSLKREYKDLSHKTTSLVNEARQHLERPRPTTGTGPRGGGRSTGSLATLTSDLRQGLRGTSSS